MAGINYNNVNKIFVSKQAGIGDVVLLTPVMRELKRQFPRAKITLMVFPNAVQAVSGLSFIDEVFAYDKKRDSIWKVISKMHGCDLALLLDLQYRPALLSFLAGIPVRAGLAHKRRFWLTHYLEWEIAMDHNYEPEVTADLLNRTLELDFKNGEMQKPYFASPTLADWESVQNMLLENGLKQGEKYLVCSPLTACYLKNWPYAKWLELMSRIYERFNLSTAIFGKKPDDKIDVSHGIINLCDQTTLQQAASLIQHSSLLVNSCSLPVHIAAAFDVPSVVLYGYGDPERWAPRKNCTIISAGISCSPCDGYLGTKCTDPECMRKITVDEVYEACYKILIRTEN